MKKWNKPQLFSLNVDMTMEDNTGETLDPKPHGQYCHKLGVNSCPGLVNEHSADGGKGHTWSGNPCPTHVPDNNGQPSCCCYQS